MRDCIECSKPRAALERVGTVSSDQFIVKEKTVVVTTSAGLQATALLGPLEPELVARMLLAELAGDDTR